MWELDCKESWVVKNWCFWTVVVGKTLESPLDSKEIQPVHPKGDQSWVFIGRTDVEAEAPITLATWCEELTHWKRPWCWERLKARGEGDNRGWDGWMASPTRVWVNSGSRWWTGKPGVLQSTESQRVGHDWATKLNWTMSLWKVHFFSLLILVEKHSTKIIRDLYQDMHYSRGVVNEWKKYVNKMHPNKTMGYWYNKILDIFQDWWHLKE